VLADIAPKSTALVLTDPPYIKGSELLYRWLAQFAARVLIPGGSLICYTGHWSLNRDMRIFDKHLRYWWMMVMLHDQKRSLPGKFMIASYKPVLFYVKGFRRGKSLIPDVLQTSNSKREKDEHEWCQGEAGVTHLIDHLTEPGELIVDPFAGTGKWGKIAASMGRPLSITPMSRSRPHFRGKKPNANWATEAGLMFQRLKG
jgi:DNA modification methylase